MAGETETTTTPTDGGPLAESITDEQAVAMMANLADDDGETQEERPDAENAHVEGDDTGEEREASEETGEEGEGEQETEQQEQTETEDDAPPQFWDAEDREAFAKLGPETKAIVRKYEQKRVQFEQEKNREVATKVKEAQDGARDLLGYIKDGAEWWKANGAEFQKNFGDKWAGVNWDDLSENTPAEYTRLMRLRDKEAEQLRRAKERGERDMAIAAETVKGEIAQRKRAAHDTLAKQMPDQFGPEKFETTYKALGQYLFDQFRPHTDASVPDQAIAARINAIHEAPLFMMAAKAWLYDEAKKKASTVTGKPGPTANTTASTTPTRVQPGPAPKGGGDRNAGEARRVGERFRKSGSVNDAARLIQLNGL